MSQNFSWIRPVFSDESMSPEFVARVNLVVGLLLASSTVILLILFSSRTLLIPRQWIYIQLGIGIVLVLGALLMRVAPSFYRPVAVLHGLLFCVLPFAYTAMMWNALSAFPAVQRAGRRIRFAHAPGILAVCMAYGLKLLSDPFVAESRQLQKRIVRIGFGAGAALDLLLVYLMFAGFASVFTQGFQF